MTAPVVPADIAFLAVSVATTFSFVAGFLGGLNAGMSLYRPMVDTVLDL